jgi:hypothetical protein
MTYFFLGSALSWGSAILAVFSYIQTRKLYGRENKVINFFLSMTITTAIAFYFVIGDPSETFMNLAVKHSAGKFFAYFGNYVAVILVLANIWNLGALIKHFWKTNKLISYSCIALFVPTLTPLIQLVTILALSIPGPSEGLKKGLSLFFVATLFMSYFYVIALPTFLALETLKRRNALKRQNLDKEKK